MPLLLIWLFEDGKLEEWPTSGSVHLCTIGCIGERDGLVVRKRALRVSEPFWMNASGVAWHQIASMARSYGGR